MAKKAITRPRVPVFASVIQPGYAWIEADSANRKLDVKLPAGTTELPILEIQDEASPTYDDVAIITVPNAGTPASNAVRIHEMLHAKITPEVNAYKQEVVREDAVSELACQFAEDFRVASAGRRLGLWGADAHYGHDLIVEMAQRAMYSEDHLRLLGHEQAGHGALTLAKAVELYCGFVGQPTSDDGYVSDPVRFFKTLEQSGVALPDDDMAEVMAICHNLNKSLRMFGEVLMRDPRDIDARGSFRGLAMRFESALRDAFAPALRESGAGAGDGGDDSDVDLSERTQVSGERVGDDVKPDERPEEEKSKSDDAPESKSQKSPLAGMKSRIGPSSHRTEIKYSKRSAIGKAKAAMAATLGSFDERGWGNGPVEFTPGTGYDREKRMMLARVMTGASDGDLPDALLNNYSLEPSDIGWPKTDIVLAPVERARKSFVPRRGKPAMDGDIPRHFGRWIVDRAILDSRGRRPGGTLLIDISGSMSWSREQINALLEELPALTVALYSSSNPKGDEGQISIVARSGRIVSSDWKSSRSHSGNNLCDGVAVSWLCKQPGPRIWLSDGAATGPASAGGEMRNSAYVGDCLRLCALGAITLTRDDREVKAILEGRIKQRPVTPEEYHRLVEAGLVVQGAEAIAMRGVRRMNDMLSGHDAA